MCLNLIVPTFCSLILRGGKRHKKPITFILHIYCPKTWDFKVSFRTESRISGISSAWVSIIADFFFLFQRWYAFKCNMLKSSVMMMMMCRFSQEFPKKGKKSAVYCVKYFAILGSSISSSPHICQHTTALYYFLSWVAQW